MRHNYHTPIIGCCNAISTLAEIHLNCNLHAVKRCSTAVVIICAGIAVVSSLDCYRLQLILSVTGPHLHISQQQLTDVCLLKPRLALALQPVEVWDIEHCPSTSLQQLVPAKCWPCNPKTSLSQIKMLCSAIATTTPSKRVLQIAFQTNDDPASSTSYCRGHMHSQIRAAGLTNGLACVGRPVMRTINLDQDVVPLDQYVGAEETVSSDMVQGMIYI